MEALERLKEEVGRTEGLAARAILNYVIYELEVGGPSADVVDEAIKIAERELRELEKAINALKEIRRLIS
ncbi:MAG: hypothetical protein TU35_004635 [Thermoproteus sp. AZ2]|uniref:Uncharacterized protein n=1 Tax=Thermoproteus sp. AZ2 TaxID=1609232 RepID=A0ACC6V1L8_9CREN